MIHQHIIRIADGLVGIAPGHVLLAQQVTGFMDLGRKGLGSIGGAENRLQRLVLHLHQFFGFFQNLRSLRRHQADGITQEMGDLPHGDHGIPVLHQVAHLYLARDVVGGIHAHNARQGLGLFLMDGQHTGPGILAADSAAVDHAVQVNVIGVFAGTQDLFPGIDTRHGFAHPGAVLFPGNFSAAAENLGRQQNGVNDLFIARAAANVVSDGEGHLLPGRVRVHIQQRLGRDDHAGNAEAALHRAGFGEGPGIDLLFRVAEALHSDNMFPLQLVRGGNAGLGGFAVDEYMAGAAGTLTAAVLHRGQAQLIPQKAQQLLIFISGYRLSVDIK